MKMISETFKENEEKLLVRCFLRLAIEIAQSEFPLKRSSSDGIFRRKIELIGLSLLEKEVEETDQFGTQTHINRLLRSSNGKQEFDMETKDGMTFALCKFIIENSAIDEQEWFRTYEELSWIVNKCMVTYTLGMIQKIMTSVPATRRLTKEMAVLMKDDLETKKNQLRVLNTAKRDLTDATYCSQFLEFPYNRLFSHIIYKILFDRNQMTANELKDCCLLLNNNTKRDGELCTFESDETQAAWLMFSVLKVWTACRLQEAPKPTSQRRILLNLNTQNRTYKQFLAALMPSVNYYQCNFCSLATSSERVLLRHVARRHRML